MVSKKSARLNIKDNQNIKKKETLIFEIIIDRKNYGILHIVILSKILQNINYTQHFDRSTSKILQIVKLKSTTP